MAARKLVPALLLSLALVLLATLGGVAGARSSGDGTNFIDISRLLAAVAGPPKLHFSGVLTENDVPVQKGNQNLRFSLWTDPSSTDPALKKWEEQQVVTVRNGGVITVFLGGTTPFPDGLFENDLFLGIELLDASNVVVTTFPRQELANVPKAFRAAGAGKADKLDDEKCAKCVKEGHVQDKAIGHEKIKDNAVRKEQLNDKAVAKEKLDDKAVSKEKIDDKAVGKEKIDDKAVSKEKIEDKAVGKEKIEDKAVGKQQLDTGAELDGLPGYSVTALAFALAGGPRSVAATIGVDGLPVIAFQGQDGLSVARCVDLACTSATINAIAGMAGSQLAIAIAPNGNPLVVSGQQLAMCADPACTTATIDTFGGNMSALAVSATGEVLTAGDDQAIDVGGHGGVVLVQGGSTVEAVICAGIVGFCGGTAVVLDPEGAVPASISMAINAQGGPFVSYMRPDGAIGFAQCDDPLCAAHSVGTLVPLTSGGPPEFPSAVIGRDGRPLVAYEKRLGSSGPRTLFVAHCSTSNCSSLSTTVATFDAASGGPLELDGSLSLTIGRDGLPLIAFHSFGQLNVLHCSNVFCVPHARAR